MKKTLILEIIIFTSFRNTVEIALNKYLVEKQKYFWLVEDDLNGQITNL